MRKNVQEKSSKTSDFFNQKLSKNTKKCIFWVQKFKIFPGEGPRTFAGWQKFLRRTLPTTRIYKSEERKCTRMCARTHNFRLLLRAIMDFKGVQVTSQSIHNKTKNTMSRTNHTQTNTMNNRIDSIDDLGQKKKNSKMKLKRVMFSF